MIQKANINSAFLPTNVKGKVKFEFRSLQDNLNTVLLAQYLQKSNNCLSKEDVAELQRSDPVLRNIIDRLSKDMQVDEKFVIKDKILFKLSLVYGIQVFRVSGLRVLIKVKRCRGLGFRDCGI